MSRELGRIATGWVTGSFLLAAVGTALFAPIANATVRVFVTSSADGYGLNAGWNAFQPTFSTVYPNGGHYDAYDYSDY